MFFLFGVAWMFETMLQVAEKGARICKGTELMEVQHGAKAVRRCKGRPMMWMLWGSIEA